MLIKSCTKKNDDCFILFGGSGSELVLCKNLGRNYISCELHPEYYQMILDRLRNGGQIKDEYRIQSIVGKRNGYNVMPSLFAFAEYEKENLHTTSGFTQAGVQTRLTQSR